MCVCVCVAVQRSGHRYTDFYIGAGLDQKHLERQTHLKVRKQGSPEKFSKVPVCGAVVVFFFWGGGHQANALSVRFVL